MNDKKPAQHSSRGRYVLRTLVGFLTAAIVSGVSLAASLPRPGGLSTTNPLMQPQGGGTGTNVGDYVVSGGGLNTFYSFYVEVPAGATALVIEMFDADIGDNDSTNGAEQRDRQRDGSWDTDFQYRLYNPSGSAVTTQFSSGNATTPAGADNAWLTFYEAGMPTFVAQSSAVSGDASPTSLTIATPSGVTTNDLLIAMIAHDGGGAISTPSGWTAVDEGANGTDVRLGVFYRFVTAGEPASHTFSWSGGEEAVGGIVAYRGADLTTPIDVSGSATGNDSSPTAPSVNTTVANTRVVRIFGADDDDIEGGSGPSSHTLRFGGLLESSDSGGSASGGLADTLQSGTGATGTAAFTLNAAEQWRAVTLAIRPAAGSITAGHWRIEVDSSTDGGDDLNGLGIRAHDGTSGSGGTEYPVYAERFLAFGVHDPDGTAGNNTSTTTTYPYITGGCQARSHDFDMDSDAASDQGQIVLVDRGGATVLNSDDGTLSTNDSWNNDNTSTIDTNPYQNTDHGIWTGTSTITDYAGGNSNYKTWWLTDTAVGDPPTGGNTPSTTSSTTGYRVYFPTDAGNAPVKPYLEQQLTYVSGANPPANPGTTTLQMTVRVVNPTAHAITFSTPNNIVTANVPGGTVTYQGGWDASQGSVVSQPSVGGSGNVTWNPGTLAANDYAIMTYQVNVTNPAAGNTYVTGQPTTNGTRAQWLDETGNSSQARATYAFGQLCGVYVTRGTSITYASISSFRAYPDGGGARVEWETSGEAGTAGWILRRLNPSSGDYERVHEGQIPALMMSSEGGVYSVLDAGAVAGGTYTYRLTEIQVNGARRQYGPYTVTVGGKPAELSKPKLPGGHSLFVDSGQANEAVNFSAGIKRGLRNKHRQSAQTTLAVTQVSRQVSAARAGRGGAAAAKLAVREEGLYYLSAADIASKLGVSQSQVRQWIKKGKVLITNRGGAVKFLPRTGNDGLYFYGEAIVSPYTEENIYWVSPGTKDMRMAVAAGSTPPTGPSGQVFTENARVFQDVFASTVVPVGMGQDFWYWDFLWNGASVDFDLPAPGTAGVGTATLRMHVQGATATPALLDHQATISVNGTVVGSGQWDDLARQSVSVSFDQAILGENNTVSVAAAGDPGSIYYVDGFELNYQRRMEAVGDRLNLNADKANLIRVDGFSSNQIGVFDISNPQAPTLIRATRIEDDNGGYRVSFAPSTTPGGRYLALTAPQALAPAWFSADEPSSLHDSGNQADYLVIAPEELAASANKLAAYRSAMASKVVMLEDIYDEFNFGIADPQAIKSFLAYAYTGWTRAPHYVALVGKGTLDYKDIDQFGTNLLPPMMASTTDGMYACDNCLADVSGDGVPEYALGRIPVTSDAEFDQYYAKLTASEASGSGRATQVAIAADVESPPANFTNDAEALAAIVPGGYTTSKIYLDDPAYQPLDNARTALFAKLNGTGASVFSYVGHGGMERLSEGGLLTIDDIGAALTNGSKMPVLVALSCLINRYEIPGISPTLGETLIVNPQGGAEAVWAPTGTSNDANARALGEKFFDAVYVKNNGRIGDAVLEAMKAFHSGQSVPTQELQVYTLLGDPGAVIPGKSGAVVQGPANAAPGGATARRRE